MTSPSRPTESEDHVHAAVDRLSSELKATYLMECHKNDISTVLTALSEALSGRDAALKEVAELKVYKRRLEWLHEGGGTDREGYEWGIYRVRWDAHGQPVTVCATFSDFSDLDKEINREQNIN